MALKDIHVLIPVTCECDTLFSKRDISGSGSEWIILNCVGGLDVTMRVLISGRQEARARVGDAMKEKGWAEVMLTLKMEEGC